MKSLSRVRLLATPWTAAHQAPPSMGFSRQEYWSGVPLPSPGDLPDPGIEPGLPHCRQTLYCLSHQGSLFCLKRRMPVSGVLWVLSQLWADVLRYLFYTTETPSFFIVSLILLARLSLLSFSHYDIKNTLETTEHL